MVDIDQGVGPLAIKFNASEKDLSSTFTVAFYYKISNQSSGTIFQYYYLSGVHFLKIQFQLQSTSYNFKIDWIAQSNEPKEIFTVISGSQQFQVNVTGDHGIGHITFSVANSTRSSSNAIAQLIVNKNGQKFVGLGTLPQPYGRGVSMIFGGKNTSGTITASPVSIGDIKVFREGFDLNMPQDPKYGSLRHYEKLNSQETNIANHLYQWHLQALIIV